MTNADAAHKITRAHHSRKAVVYLRQSSLAQVKHNTESQRLQYALAETAKLYGFRHIEVIDRDLGLSAASGAPAREGFKELLASIALGEVGLVLSRELSRLSRTDQDWCHLMELCRIFDTLLGDAENLYDLTLMPRTCTTFRPSFSVGYCRRRSARSIARSTTRRCRARRGLTATSASARLRSASSRT